MRFFFLLAGLFLCASCQNPPAESRADRIAKNISDCVAPLLQLNKQAAAAVSNGPVDFEAIQEAYEKAKGCITEQRMKPEDLPEVRKALELKYPELAAQTELLEELLGR